MAGKPVRRTPHPAMAEHAWSAGHRHGCQTRQRQSRSRSSPWSPRSSSHRPSQPRSRRPSLPRHQQSRPLPGLRLASWLQRDWQCTCHRRPAAQLRQAGPSLPTAEPRPLRLLQSPLPLRALPLRWYAPAATPRASHSGRQCVIAEAGCRCHDPPDPGQLAWRRAWALLTTACLQVQPRRQTAPREAQQPAAALPPPPPPSRAAASTRAAAPPGPAPEREPVETKAAPWAGTVQPAPAKGVSQVTGFYCRQMLHQALGARLAGLLPGCL